MKTSAVLASLLFGSLAVAAPVDKRALAYKTEIVTEVVVVYTTVWEDEDVPAATTTPAGYFYEQPQQPSSAAAQPTPPAPAPVAAEKKTSSVAPPPPPPAPTPTPAPAPSPAPAPVPSPAPEQPKPKPEEPKPVEESRPSSPAYVAPVPTPAAPSPPPAVSSAAPAPAPYTPPSSGGSSGGAQFTNVDMTVYNNLKGDLGACGTKLYDTDLIAALGQGAWGQSTYDRMTGKATNPWCGQKIKVEYEGNSIEVTIMDLCPGCAGTNDIDLSLGAWKKLTGKDELTRVKASWSKVG